MYRHSAPRKPVSLQFDVSPEGPPYPLTHVGHLRTERSFGVSHPNEDFPGTSKPDSMPESQGGGLSAKDEVVLRLSRLRPENEDQKTRQSALLGELAAVLEEISELTTEVNNQRHARLTEEHRQIRSEGRKAEQALQRAGDEFKVADVFALNMISAHEQARQNLERLHDLEQRGEHLKRFHSDKELEEWRARYAAAQTTVREAAELANAAVNDRNQKHKDLQDAQEEVNRLAGIESRIRSEMKGTAHWDSELGLGAPGQGTLTSEIVNAMAVRE